MFQSLQQRRGVASWLSSSIVLSACLVFSPQGVRTASAEPSEAPAVEVRIAPPEPLVEVVPPRPSHRHFWVHGHWGWSGRADVWVPGYYEIERRGYVYRESRWENVGGHWYFHEGAWHRR